MADDVLIRVNAKETTAAAFGKTETRVDKLGKKLDGFSKRAKTLGTGMTKWVTGPIVAVGAGILAVGIDYDNALKSMATSTGATGAALDGLGQTFKSVFRTVPDAAATVATAIGDLNTITGATGPTLQALAKNVLDASRMLGEDGAVNAKAFGRALEQFKVPAEAGVDVLDQFFKIGQDTGIGFGQLIQVTTRYGAALSNAGLSLSQTGALIGSMNKAGIDATVIMPGLSKAFATWSKDGQDVRDMLGQTIERIRTSTSATETMSLAATTFGQTSAQFMITAIRNGSFALEDLAGMLDGAEGKIQDTVEANRPLREEFQLLWRGIQTDLMPAGKALVETLREMKPTFQAIGERVAGVVQWFSELSPGMQASIGTAALLVAGLGPVIGGIGFLAAGISAALPLFGALKVAALALMGPFGLVVGAVTAAVLVWKNWDTVKEMFGKVMSTVKGWLEKIPTPLLALTGPIGLALAAFKHWDEITDIAQRVYTGVKTWLIDKFQAIVDGVKATIGAVTGFFGNMYDAVVGNSIVPDMVDRVAAEFDRMGVAMADRTEEATKKVEEKLQAWWDRQEAGVRAINNELGVMEIEAYAARLKAQEEFEAERLAAQQQHWQTISAINNELGLKRMEEDRRSMLGGWGRLWEDMTGGAEGGLGRVTELFSKAFTGGGGALGAIKAFATEGLSALMGMIPGVGPFISQFSGPIIAGFKKIGSALAGAFGFGGPSGAEQEGRRVAGTFRQGLLAELNPEQMAEVQQAMQGAWKGNEIGAATVIAIRDAYIAAGASAEDALDVVNRLWQAEQQGGEAVQVVIADIQAKIDEGLIPSTEDLNDALGGLGDDGQGTFQDLTDTIDIMQATIANTDSLDRMAAEFRKASDGSTYDLRGILREAESLTDSLGRTHPEVMRMQDLIRDASETGVWDFAQMALAIGAIKDEMATPIVIPVTPVLTGLIDSSLGGNDQLSPSNFRTREAWEANWLARNPGDTHRVDEALGDHQFADGTGGLRRFSPSGTPALLHDEEEVLTRQQGEGVATMVARAIQVMRPPTTVSGGTGDRAIEALGRKLDRLVSALSMRQAPIQINLNGVRLAEGLVPMLPGALKRRGFAI